MTAQAQGGGLATQGSRRLAVLLSLAMFVLVVDTSMMNVSISAVARDLGTTVSGVQAAIAIEALVSAAFILINSKVGDLIGRKRAYVLGLVGYMIGALAMTLTQSLASVLVFWALVGGLGAALLLPAMQSLIHGNFAGDEQKKVYAMVGASIAVAAAIGPLLGGLVTTYLSWRVGFLLEAVVIAAVLSGMGLVRDVPYTGSRKIDWVGASLSIVGMGGVVLAILAWQEGAEAVGGVLLLGVAGLVALALWLRHRKAHGRPTLLDPDLLTVPQFRLGISSQMLQQVTLGGVMIVVPIFLQIALEYDALQAGLSIAPLSLSMFVTATVVSKRLKRQRSPVLARWGFLLGAVGIAAIVPVVPRADSGWALTVPLLVAGVGLGLLVSRLNNYTLAPVSEDRVSEAAGVNSAAGSFGLSFGLAIAGGIMLATLAASFTAMSEASDILPPDDKERVATVLEEDAEVVSDSGLQALLAGEPAPVREEIVAINDDARTLALQAALGVPLLACLIGLVVGVRMVRLPDIEPRGDIETTLG
jgi:MFS family permease